MVPMYMIFLYNYDIIHNIIGLPWLEDNVLAIAI